MKYIQFYQNRNVPNADVFNEFIKTLTNSIKTFEYFVNWDKVNGNVDSIKIELNLLNSLIGTDNLKDDFIDLITEYPSTIKALPILLAVRDDKLDIMENYESLNLISFDFNSLSGISNAEKYYLFLEKSGLIELFYNRKIKNFVDYVFGVEVGLDSNGRKNRGGSLMERIVESFIEQSVSNNENLDFLHQATPNSIKSKWNYDVNFDKSARSFDCAVFNNKTNKLFLIETNFYNGGGSKLKSVCGEFKALFNELHEQNIDFIWITDGKGWLTTKRPLEETFKNNDYIFNLTSLQNDILDEVFCK